ncbi:MAG TPA: hypothetical protein VJ924_11875, partial [Alphaproteobacteria bacterium]|nr:hypothetical protein [Alphaproteobacteria bacterium]
MADASSGARGLGAGRTHAPFLRFHANGLDFAPGIDLIANVARADEPPRHLVRSPDALAQIFGAAYGDPALGRSLVPTLARIASSLDARDGFIAWSIAQEIVLPPLSDQALQRAA